MIIDCLISPSPVVVEQLDKSATVYDDDLREPVAAVRRATQVTLQAQISWTRNKRTGFHEGAQGGPQDEATGYFVFMRRDVARAGVTLQRGDRVVSTAGQLLEPPVFLLAEQRAGHLSGVANLEIWDVTDKRPSNA